MNFVDFASAHGLIIRHLITGKISRCPTWAHKNKKNGAFYYEGDWGWIKNWETDTEITIWKDSSIPEADLSKKIKDSTKKHSHERADLNAQAAKKAELILGQCSLEISAYLGRKGFPDMCTNVWFQEDKDPVLVVPMYIQNKLSGCQLIQPDGNKKFLFGQATKDAYFQIGNGRYVFFVEGYASGLSLQKIFQGMKINYKIIVCFSANNLSRLAKNIEGFVIADNDESGAGEKAAIESGRNWWMPPKVGQDINDYHLEAGIFRVSQELKKVIYKRNKSV